MTFKFDEFWAPINMYPEIFLPNFKEWNAFSSHFSKVITSKKWFFIFRSLCKSRIKEKRIWQLLTTCFKFILRLITSLLLSGDAIDSTPFFFSFFLVLNFFDIFHLLVCYLFIRIWSLLQKFDGRVAPINDEWMEEEKSKSEIVPSTSSQMTSYWKKTLLKLKP